LNQKNDLEITYDNCQNYTVILSKFGIEKIRWLKDPLRWTKIIEKNSLVYWSQAARHHRIQHNKFSVLSLLTKLTN
jgi:hypothetical protein